MDAFVNQDWEREHLKDEIYKKELEFLEQEHFYDEQQPAIIKVIVPSIKVIRNQPKLLKK